MKKFFCLAAFISLSAAYPASAHHSTTMFDHAKVVTIVGTVKEVHWTNPHVAIYIYGTSAEVKEPTLWLMEMTSPGNLVRSGEKSTVTLSPGFTALLDQPPARTRLPGLVISISHRVGSFTSAEVP